MRKRQKSTYGSENTRLTVRGSRDARRQTGVRASDRTCGAGAARHWTGSSNRVCKLTLRGVEPAEAERDEGIVHRKVELPKAKKDVVMLPRLRVVDCSFGWLNRRWSLIKYYKHLPEPPTGPHFIVYAIFVLFHFVNLIKCCRNTLTLPNNYMHRGTRLTYLKKGDFVDFHDGAILPA